MSKVIVTLAFSNLGAFKDFLMNPGEVSLDQITSIVSGNEDEVHTSPKLRPLAKASSPAKGEAKPTNLSAAILTNLARMHQSSRKPVQAREVIQASLNQLGMKSTERNVSNGNNTFTRLTAAKKVRRVSRGKYAPVGARSASKG